jgi:hypothetical protein
MNIEIEQEELGDDVLLECCIFCNTETSWWNIAANRPVCPVCSVMYEVGDIKDSKYNY